MLRSVCYDRWDILVCSKALRKDSDGSIILAWKILREFESRYWNVLLMGIEPEVRKLGLVAAKQHNLEWGMSPLSLVPNYFAPRD